MIQDFDKKIELISDLTMALYDTLPVVENLVVLDGGECTGTSSTTAALYALHCGKFKQTRQPSEEGYDRIKAQLEDANSTSTKIPMMIDAFTRDRVKVQKAATSPTLSDRGIFSTIIYQSGIIDDVNTVEDVARNCELIFDTCKEFGVGVPKLSILFTHRDHDNVLRGIFNSRLKQRGGKADRFDVVDKMISISNCYSELYGKIRNLTGVVSVDFTKDLNYVTDTCDGFLSGIDF